MRTSTIDINSILSKLTKDVLPLTDMLFKFPDKGSVRAISALRSAGYRTWGDLLTASPEDLSQVTMSDEDRVAYARCLADPDRYFESEIGDVSQGEFEAAVLERIGG